MSISYLMILAFYPRLPQEKTGKGGNQKQLQLNLERFGLALAKPKND